MALDPISEQIKKAQEAEEEREEFERKRRRAQEEEEEEEEAARRRRRQEEEEEGGERQNNQDDDDQDDDDQDDNNQNDDDQDDDDQDDDDQDDDDRDDDNQNNDNKDDKNNEKDDKNNRDKDSKDNKDTKGDKSEQQQQQKTDQQQKDKPSNKEQKPKADDNANKSVKDEGKKGKGKEGKPEGQGSSGGSGANSGAPGGTNGTPTGGGAPGGGMPGGTPSPAPGSASGVGASSAGTAGSAAAGTGTAAGGTAAGGAAAGGAAAGGAAAGGAAAGGAAAGGAAAGGSAAGAGAAGFFATPPGWIVLIIIVVIILLIGLLSFFSMMGDMVLGKIKEFLQGIWDFFETVGTQDAAAAKTNDEDVLNAARYLEDMGYDLEGMGFVKTEYEYINDRGLVREGESWLDWYDENGELQFDSWNNCIGDTTWWERGRQFYNDGKDFTVRGCEGEVPSPGEAKADLEDVESFPIRWYLVSQLRSYVDGNWGGTVFQKAAETYDTGSDSWIANAFEWVVNGVTQTWNTITDKLKFDAKNHSIKITGSSGLKCSLEDWTDKYGTSFEFLVCLHLGTFAPEFVLDLVGNGEMAPHTEVNYDVHTQVQIACSEQKGRIKVEYNDGTTVIEDLYDYMYFDSDGELDPEMYEDDGDPVIDGDDLIITIDGRNIRIPDKIITYLSDNYDARNGREKERQIYFPYILRTWHHWYRDVVFCDSNTGEPYCYGYSADNNKKYIDRSGIESISGDEYNNFKVYFSFEYGEGGIVQTKRPYYVDKIPKIIDLINNNTYHIFKGTYEAKLVRNEDEVKAMDPEERKEFASNLPYYTDKRKVKFLGSIKDGMQLLAQVKTAQAQYNLRDLKEILSYYNYIIEEEEDTEEEYSSATDKTEKMAEIEYEKWLKDWRHRVSGYFVPSEGWARYESSDPSADLNWGKYIQMDPEDMPTRTASTHTLDDRSMTIAARTVGGTGFNEDEAVCSTINGTIVAIDDSSITIKSDNGTVMNISHVATNSDLRVGDTVYIGTQVAKTTDEDINVIVKDKYHNALNAEEIVNVNVLINQYA